MATLLLRCGCQVAFDATSDARPVCPTHGRYGVARTVGMPAPRFRGACSGPHATTVDLGPFVAPIVASAGEEGDA